MNLTEKQQSVLLTLTADWQAPKQIVTQLPKEDLEVINQALKDLVGGGLVQVNPTVLGMYRLTVEGSVMKENLLGE